MRRTLIFLSTIFFFIESSYGQSVHEQEEASQRHYMDISVAGGVSHWNYPLKGGHAGMDASFSAGIGYTFFFHPAAGLQTGVSCSRISSVARLTDPMEWTKGADGSPLTDYMGERYIHRTSFENWREQEQAYLIEIPLGLRFRYFKGPESKAGLHAALGVKLAIPVYARYTRLEGAMTHTGWYEQWQLLLHDLPGRFEKEIYAEPQEESIQSRLHTVNAEVYAEAGTAFCINPHCELFLAVFGQYMANDFCAIPPDARESTGFGSTKNGYTFMNEYRGIIGTNITGSMHPWMAGLKAGLSIRPGKTKKEKQKELEKLLKQFPETVKPVYVHDTIYITDTICPDTHALGDSREQIELDSMLSEAVIWFHFDDYVPILEPAYILDSVASMMKRYPRLLIHVNGHACRIGTDRYNQRLALLRARSVAALLEQKGVSATRMYVWSYGARKPYRYNSPKQLSKDRRVEIIPDIR